MIVSSMRVQLNAAGVQLNAAGVQLNAAGVQLNAASGRLAYCLRVLSELNRKLNKAERS